MNPTTDEFTTSSPAASEESKITVSDDRLRALYLYQMLLQYTDEDHSLTTKQIQQMFEERYQIKIHRTVVPEYINLLRVAGVDVVGQRRRNFLISGIVVCAIQVPPICILCNIPTEVLIITTLLIPYYLTNTHGAMF